MAIEQKFPHKVGELEINKSCPWSFFDGSKQGIPKNNTIGGVLFLYNTHCVEFKVGLRPGSNNCVEF